MLNTRKNMAARIPVTDSAHIGAYRCVGIVISFIITYEESLGTFPPVDIWNQSKLLLS